MNDNGKINNDVACWRVQLFVLLRFIIVDWLVAEGHDVHEIITFD